MSSELSSWPLALRSSISEITPSPSKSTCKEEMGRVRGGVSRVVRRALNGRKKEVLWCVSGVVRGRP